MRQANQRRMIVYWVCCDCFNCQTETGLAFICLSSGFQTEREARVDLKNYSDTHRSCFVAKEILEAVNQRPKQRKAA
jgi:uncharacterized UBP type Zn finger protein